jgi:hypothetical protein
MPYRHRQRFPSHQRRSTTWARQTEPVSLTGATDYDTLDLLGAFKSDGGNQQGVTITRIHLSVSVLSDVSPSDTFAWGIVRGQSSDLGSNVAGAPIPAASPYADWMLWRTEYASYLSPGNGAYFAGGGNHFEIDLKAQRRLEELDMTCNLVVQRIDTGADLDIVYTASVLLKLP